jgi:hypothetical protein
VVNAEEVFIELVNARSDLKALQEDFEYLLEEKESCGQLLDLMTAQAERWRPVIEAARDWLVMIDGFGNRLAYNRPQEMRLIEAVAELNVPDITGGL